MISVSSWNTDDPIMALATPRGKGALSVIRVSGKDCLNRVSRLFSRPKALCKSKGYRVYHGWILEKNGKPVDEVVVTVFRGPASYTGEDTVEISSHGGLVVADRILDVLREEGIRDAHPGEFSFRAFVSGKMDLTRVEAVKDIIDARTAAAAAMGVSHLSGSLEERINQAKDVVRTQSAVAALALDYSEDERESVDFDTSSLEKTISLLKSLIETWNTGRIHQGGLKMVLFGAVNAGKSSLFNLFLKEERSIVAENPGTTRDWVDAWLSIEEIPVRLIDTAGLRSNAGDSVEMEGIRRTHEIAEGADILIAVADGSSGMENLENLFDTALLKDKENLDKKVIKVWNKVDRAPDVPAGYLPLCSLSGEGFSRLDKEVRSYVRALGIPSQTETPVINSVRQKAQLEKAVRALTRFGESRRAASPIDLLAEDLREALDALGAITGEVSRADVLDTVFRDFCVGK